MNKDQEKAALPCNSKTIHAVEGTLSTDQYIHPPSFE